MLRIGIWPGTFENDFVQIFSDALRMSGATVVDVQDPRQVGPLNIDVFHIHWPEQVFWSGRRAGLLFRLFGACAAIWRLKKAGVVVVWMVHNYEPHEGSRLIWRIYRSVLYRLVDGFMTLSPSTIDVVKKKLPGLACKPYAAVWHPSYPPSTGRGQRAKSRQKLSVSEDKKVYSFFGHLRPYKGVEQLIKEFKRGARHHEVLMIFGSAANAAYVDSLVSLIERNDNIVLMARRLSDEEFSEAMAAADLAVFPFRQSLHSGSIVHAISEGIPVVTPRFPFADALAEEVGAGWVNTYTGDLKFEFMANLPRPTASPRMEGLAPINVARQTMQFYERLRRNRDVRSKQ